MSAAAETVAGAIYPDLRDLPVLITGAASGIGAAIAAAFARQGARLALLDLAGERLAATSEEALRLGAAETESAVLDLRDIPALESAVAAFERRFGGFGALINNAGDDSRHRLADLTPEHWDERFAVNLRHQIFAAKAVIPGMAARGGGAIVNLGSISWMMGAAGLIAYTTAKSAVMGLTKSLARECGGQKIRVNAIAPGMIWTQKQIDRANAEDPAKLARYLERQCIKEPLEPDDIARLALWLASAESRHASGQTFILDGGVV